MATRHQLDFDSFELAMAITKDWRLARYIKTKKRLREVVGLTKD